MFAKELNRANEIAAASRGSFRRIFRSVPLAFSFSLLSSQGVSPAGDIAARVLAHSADIKVSSLAY